MEIKPWHRYFLLGFIGYLTTHISLHISNRVFPQLLGEYYFGGAYLLYAIVYLVMGLLVRHFFPTEMRKASLVFFSFFIAASIFGLFLNISNFPYKIPAFILFAFGGFRLAILLLAKVSYYVKISTSLAFALLICFAHLSMPYVLYYGIFARHHFRDYPFPSQYSFVDNKGKVYDANFFKGKTVLFEYWNTGCSVCIQKFPHTNQVGKAFANRDDVVIVAINSGDSYQRFKKFVEKREEKNLLFLADTLSLTAKSLSIKTFPRELIVDKKGTVVDDLSGFIMHYQPFYAAERINILNKLSNE